MANAIIIVVLVLICVFAVRSYCRKLKQGCCGEAEIRSERRDRRTATCPIIPIRIRSGLTA